MAKRLLFSVTLKDCRLDTFRAGGKGGQNQNKVESGVRITHLASGAVGEARDSRDQLTNKRNAWSRMAASGKFKAWHRLVLCEILSGKSIEQRVAEDLHPSKLRVEVRGERGWEPLPPEAQV